MITLSLAVHIHTATFFHVITTWQKVSFFGSGLVNHMIVGVYCKGFFLALRLTWSGSLRSTFIMMITGVNVLITHYQTTMNQFQKMDSFELQVSLLCLPGQTILPVWEPSSTARRWLGRGRCGERRGVACVMLSGPRHVCGGAPWGAGWARQVWVAVTWNRDEGTSGGMHSFFPVAMRS